MADEFMNTRRHTPESVKDTGGEHLLNEVKSPKENLYGTQAKAETEGVAKAAPFVKAEKRTSDASPYVRTQKENSHTGRSNLYEGKQTSEGTRNTSGNAAASTEHSAPAQAYTFDNSSGKVDVASDIPIRSTEKRQHQDSAGNATSFGDAAGTKNAAGSTPDGNSASKQTYTHMTQGVHYDPVPEGVKGAVSSVLKQPAEMVKGNADFNAENRSEGYDRTIQKSKEAASIVNTIGNSSRRNEIIEALNRESSRYIAGDMFFKDGSGSGLVSDYLSNAEKQGVYKGFTVGVNKAFKDVCAEPSKYYLPGTLTLDENKVMEKIRSAEVFKKDAAGNILKDEKGNGLFEVRQNQKMRKEANKALKYRDINHLEAKMRGLLGEGVFTASEEKMLGENNRLFHFGSLGDIEQSQKVVDKYLLNCIKKAGTESGDVIKIGAKTILPGELKELDLAKLGRMSKKDVKALIGKLSDVQGAADIVDALKAKQLLSGSATKIKKLGNLAGIGKTGFMMIAGDELMQSDVGDGLRHLNRGLKVSKSAYKVARTGAGLGKVVAVKGAETFAPEMVATFRAAKIARAKERAKRVRKISEKLNSLKPVRKLKVAREGVKKATSMIGSKLGNTMVGKAVRKTGSIVTKTFRILMKPIQLVSGAVKFVTSKILLPIAIAFGLLAVVTYIIMIWGNGSGSISSSIVTTILSDDIQFKGGTDENGNVVEGYQQRYDSLDDQFQSQVDGIINGSATTKNLRGETIGYGINFGGLNENGVSIPAIYKNGVTLQYFYDGTEKDGISSNIEDVLSAMTVIMQQGQSEHHAEALDLITALYKSTHSYTTYETPLYPSETGTSITQYFCNEWQGNAADGSPAYWSTDMKYKPWIYGEMHKPSDSDECPVCKQAGLPYHEYIGCEYLKTCYHGADGDMGRSHEGCDNYEAVYECPGHDHTDSEGNTDTDYCSGPLGCDGYYQCNGHEHKYCPGHYVATDYGHVDLNMSINIASLNKIFEFGGVPVVEEKSGAVSPEGTDESESSAEGGGSDG